MDLAVILSSSEPIATNYNTFILWALPIQDHSLSDQELHEVGMLEYKRGTLSILDKWNLYQGICTNYQSGETIFNMNGI